MEKPCKECPWVIKNNNNTNLTNHSKKHNKLHNCHMVDPSKVGSLWDNKKEFTCVGCKKYFN
jgi:hypothetical protein